MDLPRSPGHAASTVCDAVYASAPRMSNEIINRNKISGQAASARQHPRGSHDEQAVDKTFGD